MLYSLPALIKSFRHSGLEAFFLTGNKAGIQAPHSSRLRRQLSQLNAARAPRDMNVPSWKFHPLVGKRTGEFAVSVSANWRLVFRFEDGDAILVNYEDFH